jgi:hypothetical protein
VQTQIRQCGCSDFFNFLVGCAFFFGMEAAAAAATAGRLLLQLQSAATAAAVLGAAAAAAGSWATALVRLFVCVVAIDVELVRLLVKVIPEPSTMKNFSVPKTTRFLPSKIHQALKIIWKITRKKDHGG